MDRRKRLGLRLHRALLYWERVRPPRGRAAARERYTPPGKCRAPPDDPEAGADGDRSGD